MSLSHLAPVVVHWLHVMSAIIWIGGMVFASWVLQPVLSRSLSASLRMPLYREMGKRFKMIQLAALGALLATGAYKLWELGITVDVFGLPYGRVLMMKLTLVLAVIILSALHSYIWGPQLTKLKDQEGSAAYQAVLKKLYFWGRVNLALAVGIVFCGALLRVSLFY